MALFGVPNGEIYAGGIGLIIAIAATIWLMRNKGDRLALENQKIGQEEELERLEIKARKEEKKQRSYAKQIRNFLSDLNTTARNAGFNVDAKAPQFQILSELLEKILGEKSVTRAIMLVRDFNAQKDNYLLNFPVDNPEIKNFITSINQSVGMLYGLLVKEYNDLRKEFTALKKLEAETGQELAGLNP